MILSLTFGFLILFTVLTNASPAIAKSPTNLGYGLASRRSEKILKDPNYFSEFKRGFSVSQQTQPRGSSRAYLDGQKYRSLLEGTTTKDRAEFLAAFRSKATELRTLMQDYVAAENAFYSSKKPLRERTTEYRNLILKKNALENEKKSLKQNHVSRKYKYHVAEKPIPWLGFRKTRPKQ